MRTEKERRREQRHSCSQDIHVFLSHEPGGTATTQLFRGKLLTISRQGAGIALEEVMAGSTHLAFGPMESDSLCLNVVFSLPGPDETLTLGARPIWLNKVQQTDVPPFQIGIEFAQPLAADTLQLLKRQCL